MAKVLGKVVGMKEHPLPGSARATPEESEKAKKQKELVEKSTGKRKKR
jgi:hypothetical protein